MNLDTNLSKLKFAFITINFHPTDIESFNVYYNTIFLPYIKQSSIYISSTEYDESAQRHLHCVIGYTSEFESDAYRVRTKLKAEKHLKHLRKIYNTNDAAFDVKPIDKEKTFEIYKTMGYCLKYAPDTFESNMLKTDLDACYKAYMYSESKPIAPINHNIEHKQLSKGNLLSYMYDSFIKSEMDLEALPFLESYMIQHLKLSFINIQEKQKIQALKELKLRLSKNKNEYMNYKTECELPSTEEDLEKYYEQYLNPKMEMIKEIKYLRSQLNKPLKCDEDYDPQFLAAEEEYEQKCADGY